MTTPHDGDRRDGVPVFAPWPRRVAAAVIDWLPIAALAVLAIFLMWLTRNRVCDGDPSVQDLGPRCGGAGVGLLGQVCFLACWLAMLGYGIWNFGRRQGRTGSSLGKSVLKLRVVDEMTHAPIGFWRALIRHLAHVVDALPVGIGFLWPLWDSERQTFCDKLASTVCVSEMR